MRANLLSIYQRLQESFWFIPSLLTIASLAIAYISLSLDRDYPNAVTRWLYLPEIHLEGGRQIVTVVASSIITVSSLVFSLTFVALTTLSQQLGPRLLIFFMNDRLVQFILGYFIGLFLFSLTVLGAIGAGDSQMFVPQISIYFTAFSALLAFVLMIFFIHHIAQSVQTDKVIFRLGEDLKNAITKINSVDDEHKTDISETAEITGKKYMNSAHSTLVPALRSGYIQFIDYATAEKLVTEHDSVIEFKCRPGHFVIEDVPVGQLYGNKSVEDELIGQLQETVQMSEQPSQSQYAEFEFNALVEIALRALSPATNDPFSAISCINQITDGLAQILRNQTRPSALYDENEKLRVVLHPQSFSHFFDTVFHPLRQNGLSNMQVLLHLCFVLATLANFTQNAEQRSTIETHVKYFQADLAFLQINDEDRANVEEKLTKILDQLDTLNGE